MMDDRSSSPEDDGVVVHVNVVSDDDLGGIVRPSTLVQFTALEDPAGTVLCRSLTVNKSQ